MRRYQSQRNQLDDNDHLLDNTDDDDVEPLDPNPDRLLDDHTMQRTTSKWTDIATTLCTDCT